MGISGLLPLLKSISKPTHIQEYGGMRVAVDTYSWLHKAAFCCARELCHNIPTDRFIGYCMHRVQLLRHHGVTPVLVFDGGPLPMKGDQENKRARSRKENFEKAMEHEKAGNVSAAFECYQKAVDVTPEMAWKLIKVLEKENVEFIVAPYEADAQLAYLATKGYVNAVITEDSDLVAYGCPKILFKMDKCGQGMAIDYCDIVKSKELNFTNFTKQMVLEMCVLSGCDYLQSLPGMGLKKAHGLLRRLKTYTKVLKHLRFNGATIPPDYEETCGKALLTFNHQLVYDPVLKKAVNLTELPAGSPVFVDFVGPDIPDNVMQAIARGEVNPITREPFQELRVEDRAERGGASRAPPQPPPAQAPNKRKKLDLPVQKNKLANYFVSVTAAAKRDFRAPRNSSSPADSDGALDSDSQASSLQLSAEVPPRTAKSLLGRTPALDSQDSLDLDDLSVKAPAEEAFLDFSLEREWPSSTRVGDRDTASPAAHFPFADSDSDLRLSPSSGPSLPSTLPDPSSFRHQSDADTPTWPADSPNSDWDLPGMGPGLSVSQGSDSPGSLDLGEGSGRTGPGIERTGSLPGPSRLGPVGGATRAPAGRHSAYFSRPSAVLASSGVEDRGSGGTVCSQGEPGMAGGGGQEENEPHSNLPSANEETGRSDSGLRDDDNGPAVLGFASNVQHVPLFTKVGKEALNRLESSINRFAHNSNMGARASGLRRGTVPNKPQREGRLPRREPPGHEGLDSFAFKTSMNVQKQPSNREMFHMR